MPNPLSKPKRKPDWNTRAGIAFFVVFVLMVAYFEATEKPVKKKQACENISCVNCPCVPNHCQCFPGGRCCEACVKTYRPDNP